MTYLMLTSTDPCLLFVHYILWRNATLCLKNAPTLKRSSRKLWGSILITFGRNIQNTLLARIEFVCFSFHVGLLLISHIIISTDYFSDCSLALRFVFLTRHQRLDWLCWCFHQYAHGCLPLPRCLSTVPNFLNFSRSLLILFSIQPLFGNSDINCQAS